jgi:hypothetical protein
VSIQEHSNPLPASNKPFSTKDLRIENKLDSHHLPTDTCNTDPDLATVVAAWPDLPEAICAGILAMVKAALKGGGR